MKKPTAKHRLQFDFSDKAIEQIDELVILTEAASRAEVIRNALKLMSLYMKLKKANGGELIVKDWNAKETIILL